MKLKLGKTATSRTRAKEKAPLSAVETTHLKQLATNNHAGFIDYLMAKGYSHYTAARYMDDFLRFEKWLKTENIAVEMVGYNDVLHYIQGKKSTVQQITISSMLRGIKHYYNYLVAAEIIKESPVTPIVLKGIKRKKLYDILDKTELENLYHSYEIKENKAYATRTWYQANQLGQHRNKVIIGLLIYQGLSTTDLQRLKLNDLQLREGKIFIAGTRKSNERALKLESVQILDLMEYTLKTREQLLELTEKQTDQLLISTGKSHSLHNVLQKLIPQLQKINSKIENIKHIRASVITHWLKIHNLRETQYMAGHRYVSSTEAYLVNDLEGLQEDITKFHPLSELH
jgi:integrase/recombinase XerD